MGRVGLLAFVLGSIVSVNATFLLLVPFLHLPMSVVNAAVPYSLYLLILGSFHALEFFCTALYNGAVATSSSFVVDHSQAYTMAFLVATAEYALRTLYRLLISPGQISPPLTLINCLGLVIVASGQALRSSAMKECGSNFNHIIQTNDTKENHTLVRTGVYRVFRHPSYTGWFYWSIGTQLVLGNFLSSWGYAYASWKFFSKRIPYEEKTLEKLFGVECYDEYRNSTIIGIPFLKAAKSKVK